jgi:hypothetical protein
MKGKESSTGNRNDTQYTETAVPIQLSDEKPVF